ncbi:MAG: hypothetical protein PHR00_02105 [Patescibacteria group bacterium]|nr:hypothetical protein [Patescibacteria group bacterium]
MKKFFVLLVFFSFMASFALAQDLTLEFKQGYPMSPDTKKYPEFRIDIFGAGSKKINNLEFNVEYSSVNTLDFEFYASGTRYKDNSDAKDKWWTNNPPPFSEKATTKHKAYVNFRVGLGDPVDVSTRFKFLELYFHFNKDTYYKYGDVIVIKINGIKVKFGDGSQANLPDQEVRLVFDVINDVVELSDLGIKPFASVVSDYIATDIKLIDFSELDIFICDLLGNIVCRQKEICYTGNNPIKIDLSNLTVGHYLIQFKLGQKIANTKFIIRR